MSGIPMASSFKPTGLINCITCTHLLNEGRCEFCSYFPDKYSCDRYEERRA